MPPTLSAICIFSREASFPLDQLFGGTIVYWKDRAGVEKIEIMSLVQESSVKVHLENSVLILSRGHKINK